MRISVRSPTRVDLAGGTLDCWPLYLMVGDCSTVNLSISILTSVDLVPRSDERVIINVMDLKYNREFASLADVLNSNDDELALIRVHLQYWQPSQGFELTTQSQSPVGAGLGGSSSLCISLIKAFSLWLGESLELGPMVTLASNLEAQILKKPTGTQDYFPAAQPGLNVIHYGPKGPQAELITFDEDLFRNQLILVYTGRAHHSGINNWHVLKAAIEGDQRTLSTLRQLADISEEMEEACRKAKWKQLPDIFRKETEARIRLSPGFSSPEIVQLEKLAMDAGAEAIKICGAGGGGCVAIWTSPNRRSQVEEACQSQGFQILKADPVVGQ